MQVHVVACKVPLSYERILGSLGQHALFRKAFGTVNTSMCNKHGEFKNSKKAEKGLLRSLVPYLFKLGLGAGLLKAALNYFRANRTWLYRWLRWVPNFNSFLAYTFGVSILKFALTGTKYLPGEQLLPASRQSLAAALASKPFARRLLQRKEELAQRLSGAIRFKTVSYDYEDTENKADYREMQKLHAYLQTQFPLVHSTLQRRVINTHSLVYHWEGSDNENQRPYLLYAHMDVVPAIQEEWSEDPFSGSIKDGYIFGRGTIDLKHMVLGYMEALEDLIHSGFRPKRSIYIALGHDEEVGGRHGAAAIAGWFLDQGMSEEPFEFMWDEGLFVIDNIVPGHDGPVALICASEKGSMTLKLSVTTEPGHSSVPPKEGSIGILASAMSKLEKHPMPGSMSGVAEDFFGHIATGFGGPMRFIMSNLWLFGGLVCRILEGKHQTATMVRTTTALTTFHSGYKNNVCPAEAAGIVNHRVHPNNTLDEVLKYDKKIVDDPRVKFEVISSLPPSPVSSSMHPAYKTLQHCVHSQYPTASVGPSVFVANSDSRHFWDVADQIYRFNPIRLTNTETKLFHGIDEKISVDNYVRTVVFIRHFIEMTDARFCKRTEPPSKYNE